jgi:ABC-type branched-subunit amino acid transport system ATPase component
MFYTEHYMFGSTGLGLTEPRPHLSWINLSSDKGYYYVVLVIAVIATLGIVALNRSRLGRLLRGLADSPTGLATSGTSINVTRVLVFCLSAFLAAIAGALAGGAVTTVTGDSYQPLLSLIYFALIIITLGGEPWYALLASAGLTLIPSYFTGANTGTYLQLAFGAAALVYALTPESARSIPPTVQRLLDRLARRPGRPAPTVIAGTADGCVQRRPAVASGALEVRDLRVQFGGLVAVDGISLSAPTGRITGLIGPNGAGKTTTFNACSGLNHPTAGRITLDGHNISHSSPAARARHGLGRTFQQMELFDSLTVRQNVSLGMEGAFAGPNPVLHLFSTPTEMRAVNAATAEALHLCGLEPLADRPAGVLSTGQRRLVEVARCLAGPFRILLLDEPSSGLDRTETQRFGAILQRVVQERGVGILLVEHDMALVTRVCDYIYVLDFGEPIFEGTPAEVMDSAIVQAAYLGSGAVEEAIPVRVGEEVS